MDKFFLILFHIIIGYFNLIKYYLNLLNPIKRILFKQRLNICLSCANINKKTRQCNICGCIVDAKTKVNYKLDNDSKSIDGCPKKYW